MDDHVETLRRYNRWRRGQDCEEMQDPRVVGDAIDAACDKIDRLRAELAEARKPDCRRCSYHYACAKLKRYPCDNGEDFVLHILRGAVRLYEKEGE